MAAGTRSSLWALGLCLCAALGARAETVDFQDGVAPSAAYAGTRDAIIKNGATTLNFGDVPRLRVTTQDIGTNAQTWALLRWDISAHVPPGAVVTGVTITLDVEADDTGQTASLYQLRRTWTEGDGTTGSGVTWATTNGTTAWGTAGAESTTTDRGATVIATIAGAPAGPRVATFGAAGLAVVQGWVDDPSTNFGVILRGTTTDAVDYGSRETGTLTRRPKLTVTFTPPAATLGATVTLRDGTAGYTGTRDAYIRSSVATTNFGATDPLRADGNETSRALLRWDVSSIPATATVTAASVVLNVENSGGTSQLFQVRRDWVESQVTWNLAATGTAWTTAGADDTTNDRGATALGTLPDATGSQTVALGAAGVALVQGWVATPSTSYGLVVRATTNGTTTLSSREDGTAANRPALVVTYTSGVVKTIAGGSTWSNPAAWTPAGLPTAADVVQVNGPGSVSFTGGAATVRRLVTSGAGVSVTGGTLTVTELTWLSGGDLVVGSGATFTSTGVTDVLHTARVDLQGGSLRLGASTCWVGGTLKALNGRIEQDVAGTPTDVEVRGALDLDGPTVRGGGLEGLRVLPSATVTRLRRTRFEAIWTAAASRYLTIEAEGPVAISAPGCSFDAIGATPVRNNVLLVDTSGAGEDVVLNLEDRGVATSGAGAGAAREAEAGGASINWVWACPDTTAGTPLGFPQVAYDLLTFAEYAMYVGFKDVDPTGTDRIHRFDPAGDGVDQGTWFDVPAAQGDIVGYPWWDQVAGDRVLWVVTTTGRLYRFRDPGPGAGSVAPDAGFPKVVTDAGQPVVFTTPPITSDSLTVFVGGTRLGAPRLYAFAASTGNTAWTISTGLPDPITSELGTETIQGRTRLFAGGGSTLPGGGVVLLAQPFNANAGTFTYLDDQFRGTNNPTKAAGAWGAGFGRTGGGVRVTLGDQSVNMSGGFRSTFTVPGSSSVPIRVSVSYRLIINSQFEFDEYGELLLAIDGVLAGTAGNDYVARFFGDGNGGANMDTGWQTFTVVRQLAPGSHTLTLGGYLNKTTEALEVATCSFDDVNVQTSPTEGRIYRFDASAQLIDAEDGTPFAPVVAAPFPAFGTGVFVGDTSGRMHGIDPNPMTPLPGWPVQGGTQPILGSVWLDFTNQRVYWGDEGATTHGRTVAGAVMTGFPLANPLGDGAAIRNVTSAGGVLWIAGQAGRLRAYDAAPSAAPLGTLYRFGAQHPLGPIGQDWTGRPAIQAGRALLVLDGQTDPTAP